MNSEEAMGSEEAVRELQRMTEDMGGYMMETQQAQDTTTLDPSQTRAPPKAQSISKKLFRKAPGFITATISERANAQGCVFAQFVDHDMPSGIEDPDKLGEELGLIGDDLGVPECWPLAAEQINTYFQNRANLLLIKAWVSSVDDGATSISCLIGTMFDEEDLEELDVIQRTVDAAMTQYREERAKTKEAEERAAREAQEQLEADAALGKKAREHNLLGKLEQLDAKLKRALKQRNKAAQAAGIKFDDSDESEEP